MQLYRMLWIYVAVHELARDTPSKTHKRQWPQLWRQAAVRIAQGPTPLLVAGGEMDVDQVEAGECVSSASVFRGLQLLLYLGQNSRHGGESDKGEIQ